MTNPISQYLRVKTVEDVAVVTFVEPELESEAALRPIQGELDRLIEGGQAPKLLLDLGGVRFLSSSLLGKLVSLNRRVAEAKGQLKLCALTPYLRAVFETAGLHRAFSIYPDEPAALTSFRAAGAPPAPEGQATGTGPA